MDGTLLVARLVMLSAIGMFAIGTLGVVLTIKLVQIIRSRNSETRYQE